jgi:hypothetical protein
MKIMERVKMNHVEKLEEMKIPLPRKYETMAGRYGYPALQKD